MQSAGVSPGRRKGRTSPGTALAALAALAVLAAGLPARAGQDPGVRLGIYRGADAEEPVTAVGVFGRLDVPGPVNLEISADFRREHLAGGDLEAIVVPVRVSALFSFLPVVSPYVLAGIGVDFLRVDLGDGPAGSGSRSDLAFEVHAGVGVEIGLGPVSVIGDLRYCSVEPMSDQDVRDALGRDYDASGWYASISAGISF